MDNDTTHCLSLPTEIWVHIFGFVVGQGQHRDASDLGRLALVCSRWRTISEDDLLWSPLFASSPAATSWLQGTTAGRAANAGGRPKLKGAWGELARVEANWAKGECKISVVELAAGHAVACSLLDEPRQRLILGTMATTLELVDLCAAGGGEGASGPRLRERTEAEPMHKAHQDAVRALKLSPDGRLFASASNDHTVRVWDAETLECRHTLTGHTDSVRLLAYAPHGISSCPSSPNILISASRDRTVRIWDADRGTLVHALANSSIIHAIGVDGTTAALGCSDGSIRVVSLETGKTVQRLSGHKNWTTCLQVQSNTLVSGSSDRNVIEWDLRQRTPVHVFQGHTAVVNAVLLHGPSNEEILSCSSDGSIRKWSRTHGLRIQTLAKRSDGIGAESRTRCLNDVITMQTKHFVTRPDTAMVISANSGVTSSGIRLWELGSIWRGEEASLWCEVKPQAKGILSLAVSPRYLVATTWDAKAVVCDFGVAEQSIRWTEADDVADVAVIPQPYVPPWQRRQHQHPTDDTEPLDQHQMERQD